MSAPRVVTFGEIMLRLSPPGVERLFQSPALSATFGGGEANVAVSLAHFGCDSVYVTRVPAHAVGDAAVRSLRAEGVDVTHVARGGTRLGIYFAETGASQRAAAVIYDRAHAAVADVTPGAYDWPRIFAGARWFHLTGITPALGAPVAAAAREAVDAARAAGLTVSLDLNYRAKLWTRQDAQQVMPALAARCQVLIANEEDLDASLGVPIVGADVTRGALTVDGYAAAAREVAARFGSELVAVTLRESHSASHNGWRALLWDARAETLHQSQRYDIALVDRIGGGDSFAAGLIYGRLQGWPPDRALRFAVAASALKQTIPGDFNRVSVDDVERLASGDASGRVQR